MEAKSTELLTHSFVFDSEKRLQSAEGCRDQIFSLVNELTHAMSGRADEDMAFFERGARSLSALLRANTSIGVWADTLKEQIAKDYESDNEKIRTAETITAPEKRATMERIHFESARHLYALTNTQEDKNLARKNEK